MIKKFLFSFLLFLPISLFSQAQSATYFESGINSPWAIAIDYDFGFAKFLSINTSLMGGVSSQVNRVSTFGDVYFGELRFGPRFYMNKPERWEGLYIEAVGRIGIYNVPFRTANSTLVLDRQSLFLYGVGIYIGYKWKRPLVNDMTGFPFSMAFEPYIGWSLDSFLYSSKQSKNINRFTVGLTFKLGFYTYPKKNTTNTNEPTEKDTVKQGENNE